MKKNYAVVRSGLHSKHVLRETLLPWKKLLETDVMKGEKVLKEAKILESLNHPNLVNFKNVTSRLQLCLNMYHLVFPRWK